MFVWIFAKTLLWNFVIKKCCSNYENDKIIVKFNNIVWYHSSNIMKLSLHTDFIIATQIKEIRNVEII